MFDASMVGRRKLDDAASLISVAQEAEPNREGASGSALGDNYFRPHFLKSVTRLSTETTAIPMDNSSTSAPRVPAWKRIGLKLKYAKDTAEENKPPISTSNPDFHQEPFKSGKRSAQDVQQETPAKRIKTSNSERGKSGLRESVLTSQAFTTPSTKTSKRIVFDDEDQPISADGGRSSSLRKSVSFTPDTKNEDGFSASNFFKAWANGGNGDTSEKIKPEELTTSSKEAPKNKKSKKKNKNKSKSTLISAEELTEGAKPKKSKIKESKDSKKSRKSAGSTEAVEETTTTITPTYITYVTQYHTNKATWRFNKKHQNNLLKNLFNVYRIPPKHNPAIVAYIAGLQGSARNRVAEEAAKVLMEIGGEDVMGAEGDWEARQNACFSALEQRTEEFAKSAEEAQKDGEWEEARSKVERGNRAQAILKDALNDEELLSSVFATSSNGKALVRPVNTTTVTTTSLPSATEDQPELDKKPQRRKRKARTDVSSSSSDSSSSESSSSSSENESSSGSDSDSD